MATKNGFVESLVMSETAIGPPAAAEPAAEPAADDAGAADAAAEEATAAAEEATAAADDVAVDDVLELQAAKVTDRAPTTAMAATALPRVKR
jgi:membrane protein involved in colicin uptake